MKVAGQVSLEALRPPGAVPLAAAAFGMGFASAAYWTFARDFMIDVGGLSAATSSIAWVVIGLAGFVGGAAGDLVRRFGMNPVHRGSLLALAAALALLALLPGQALSVHGSAALFGAAYIMLTGVYLVWGVELFVERPAIGLGLPFLMIALGQVVGSPVAGSMIGFLGHASSFAAFSIVAVGTMAASPLTASGRLPS